MDKITKAPDYLLRAFDSLRLRGIPAYLVGGCVRDLMLGLPVHDFDIAAGAPPDEIAAAFDGYRLILDGMKHGTVAVMIDGHKLEITAFRGEGGYSDGRHPDSVFFVPDIEADLKRRDFTINAMALPVEPDGQILPEKIIDPLGGMADLPAKKIRAAGDPTARFSEDGLRVMRALRFSCRLGFEIEAETAAAVRSCRHMLSKVSREKIAEEFYKILLCPSPGKILAEYGDVFTAAVGTFPENTGRVDLSPEDFVTRCVILFGDAAADVLSGLKRPKAEIASAKAVSEALTAPYGRIHRFLVDLGYDDTRRVIDVKYALGRLSLDERLELISEADALIGKGAPLKESQLGVSSEELMALGYSGVRLGKLRRELLYAVADGVVGNNRTELIEYINKTEPR